MRTGLSRTLLTTDADCMLRLQIFSELNILAPGFSSASPDNIKRRLIIIPQQLVDPKKQKGLRFDILQRRLP